MNNSEIQNNLWGEGVPYSQVYLSKEIRILGSGITREVFYIYADINPKSYNILFQHKNKITDTDIHRFLEEAEFDKIVDGYKWYIFSANVEMTNTKEIERIVKKANEVIIKIHEKVMEILDIDENQF